MRSEEITSLIKKKEKEGKSPRLIIQEIKNIYDSGICLKHNDKEIKRLQEKANKLEKERDQLKKKLMNKELKNQTNNQPLWYHDKPFPERNHVKRVEIVLKDNNKPLTISEIGYIAYGLTLNQIRDCLLALYYLDRVEIKEDKYCLV